MQRNSTTIRVLLGLVLFCGLGLPACAQTAVATVGAGSGPNSVAVNPVTNKIYVANAGSANVTVIDGATNSTATVSAGTTPISVAVNPLTNKIYIANQGSANVTVIDGATNLTTTVSACRPFARRLHRFPRTALPHIRKWIEKHF